MTNLSIDVETFDRQRTNTIIIGGLIGAIAGVGAASLLLQRAERKNSGATITAGEGLRLGLLVLGLMRSIAQLGDEE